MSIIPDNQLADKGNEERSSKGQSGCSLELALAYNKAGINVIPIRPNRLKKPAVATWEEWQEERQTDEKVRAMWDEFHVAPLGLAAVCGPVSGGRYLIDFDTRAEEIFPAFCDSVALSNPA